MDADIRNGPWAGSSSAVMESELAGGAFGDVALQRFCPECGELVGIVGA
ncbi:hypothetical protein BN971_00543 [Mycobacterium bohemicum DSM 44277]|uniref:Uncharacterized protein n=1 Tax=Mycobacterium bohemicum DSM 44277 TaxID=1236609 RepID=A0A0U0W581_MYCBE|nr:hypothetical protein BN971_00543 [Mycobacterium bohemicum DSM 44277]